MLEDFFIIPKHKIDDNWKPMDLSYEFFCLEYCEEILDIPLLYIDDTSYGKDGLSIDLKNIQNRAILDEDWYIQLQRLAKYARAS